MKIIKRKYFIYVWISTKVFAVTAAHVQQHGAFFETLEEPDHVRPLFVPRLAEVTRDLFVNLKIDNYGSIRFRYYYYY